MHSDDNHTSLKGVTVKGPRQRSWSSFELCMAKHKLVVSHLDAADQTLRYLQQGIGKPFDVKIKWFMQRVAAINRDIPLSCLA